MKCEVISSDNFRLMPWKNGLGTTCEMMRLPQDDGSPFIWRLSMADISEKKSAFSPFNGYCRIINTLSGNGMRLSVDGVTSRDLLCFDPFIFSGDSQVESQLLDGPIKDFNLIFNPEKCSARLQWASFKEPGIFCSQAKYILVFSCEAFKVFIAESAYEAGAQGLVYIHNDSAEMVRIQVEQIARGLESHYCVIEIN